MKKNSIKFSGQVGVYDPLSASWWLLNELTVGEDERFKDVDITAHKQDECYFDHYILPGFVDAHCHLLETPYYSELSSEIWDISEYDLIERAVCNLRVARNSGITTLKDLGGRNYLSFEVEKARTCELSRVFTSGCYFTWVGGHEYDRGAIEVPCFEKFYQHLIEELNGKTHFVKILHDDIGIEPHLLRQMIDAAHGLGMKVSCHAYTNKAAKEAVEAGTDILEHAGDYDEALLTAIKDAGIIVVPTFAAAYDSTCENCADLTDINPGILERWLAGEKAVIPKIVKMGIPFALGSDAGFYCFPMDYLHREIELLHESFGISMEQLMYSAFVTTPQCLDSGNKLGRIASNYFADFLVYKENPLKNPLVLRNPNQVWIGGRKVVDMNRYSLQIQRITPNYIGQITHYLSHNYFNCGKLDDQWTADELTAWINNPSDYCIGAFWGQELIGFCLSHFHVEVSKVHMENIFVKEEYRHHGVGRALLDATIDHYKSSDSKIRFIGMVDAENTPSIHLLKENGFNVGSKMLWMQRNINSND